MELKDFDEYETNEATEETYRKPTKNKKVGLAFFVIGLVCFLLAATMLAVVGLTIGKDLLIKEKEENIDDEYKYSGVEVREMIEKAEKETKKKTEDKLTEELQSKFFNAALEDNGILFYFRETYPDNVVYQTGSKFEFFPINSELAPNIINNDCIVIDEETGRYSYVENGEQKTHVMIDVSSFQKNIDWEKVAADGVEYAMIRCAFRGYESGKLVTDSFFEKNIEGATKAGIKVGVYFFSQAITPEEAIEEAEYTLELIAPYKISLPVAIDVEDVSGAARTDILTPDETSELSKCFMDRIKEEGYDVMIYSNSKFFIKRLNMDILEGYDKWYAQYNTSIYFPYEISIWQYSSKGKVDGIVTNGVDMNMTFREY